MRSAVVKTEEKDPQDKLQRLAREVMSEISELDRSHTDKLLGAFVSELFRLSGEQKHREMRRRKQAAGIAAAKERGVQFGRERIELPETFPELARLWQDGGISSRRAAGELGISYQTFRRRAKEYCAATAQPQ